jgi:hypothetical protein
MWRQRSVGDGDERQSSSHPVCAGLHVGLVAALLFSTRHTLNRLLGAWGEDIDNHRVDYFRCSDLFTCICISATVCWNWAEPMRLTITRLMILVIGLMLVGTVLAECANISMPCCAQEHSTNCHEICAIPTADVNGVTAPQFAGHMQMIVTLRPVLPAAHVIPTHINPTSAPSAQNLLMRIHVLLI